MSRMDVLNGYPLHFSLSLTGAASTASAIHGAGTITKLKTGMDIHVQYFFS